MALPTYLFTNLGSYNPRSIVSDNAGNFYFSQVNSDTIYKINSAGTITPYYTLATYRIGSLAFNSDFTYLYAFFATGDPIVYSIYKIIISVTPTETLVIDNLPLGTVTGPLVLDATDNIFYSNPSGKKVMKLISGGSPSEFSDLTSSIGSGEIKSTDKSISISSTGGTPYMYVIYSDGSLCGVAKINASTGVLDNATFISNSSDLELLSLLPNNSGIFIISYTNVYKYSYSGGSPLTSSYISPNTFPSSFETGTFDYTGTYLYIFNVDALAANSIITTKAPQVICFKEGSKILCLQGTEEEYVEIEKIRKNMLVKTGQSGYKRVDKIGTTVLYNDHSNKNCLDNLYICKKEDYPELTEDLIITGSHSILVDTMTDKQKETSMRILGDIYVTENKYRLAACIDSRTKPYDVKEKVNIWHLSLEHPNKLMNYGIYANGLLVESASKRMMTEISGMKMV